MAVRLHIRHAVYTYDIRFTHMAFRAQRWQTVHTHDNPFTTYGNPFTHKRFRLHIMTYRLHIWHFVYTHGNPFTHKTFRNTIWYAIHTHGNPLIHMAFRLHIAHIASCLHKVFREHMTFGLHMWQSLTHIYGIPWTQHMAIRLHNITCRLHIWLSVYTYDLPIHMICCYVTTRRLHIWHALNTYRMPLTHMACR